MVAISVFNELQLHGVVIDGVVEPSRNVPIAVNCCSVVVASEMIGVIGSIAMDAIGVLVTVSVVVPLFVMVPEALLMGKSA